MRREKRNIRNNENDLNLKILKYSSIGLSVAAIIVFGLLIYLKNINNEAKEEMITGKELTNIINDTNILQKVDNNKTESASSEIGKSINQVENQIQKNETIKNKTVSNNVLTTDKITSSNNITSQTNSNNQENNTKQEKTVELKFDKPVEGDIVKEFAIDKLVYSETLKEWTTHTGIDIKAEKTSVVKTTEAGTVKNIKNDPRFGLTVIVEHENGFQSVYSNLLTSEFVVEGEKVEKGQSIGTVGNTAAFEIADEPHLHFEILKDNIQVDPSIYLK